MQDRTINNALLAILREGGEQAELAKRLMDLRGVPMPRYFQDRPLNRGQSRRIVLTALKDGPKTSTEVGRWIQRELPDLPRRKATHRAALTLKRLGKVGLVRREAGVWLTHIHEGTAQGH